MSRDADRSFQAQGGNLPDNKLIKSALELQSALDTRPCAEVAEAIEATSRVERSIADTLRAIEENSGIKQMLESVKHHEAAMRTAFGSIEEVRRLAVLDFESPARREMQLVLESVKHHGTAMRTAFGPIEELRRVGLFDADSAWRRDMELVRQAMVDFETRFRLPEISETARLMMEFSKSPLSESLARYAEQTSSLQLAVESMRTPWLDAQESMRSMAGFAELQGIGSALMNMPSFGDRLASALRIDLGDWRDPILWRPEIFTDLAARSDLYVSLGFNVALTDFPAPAFEQSLDIAGLRREPPPLVDRYGAPVPRVDDDDEEEGLARTNMAHDWLLRLETQLREFIDERMTQAFGADWPKRRLPNGLYDAWQEKKRKAKEAGGREWPLVAYADFTDYERVICRSDNWREIFAPFFGRSESVRESFQRLYPIRLDTMHSRPITQDDELLLYVETRRLVKVIVGRRS
jgi:hypothetical protein